MIRGFSDHAANERTYLAWVRTGIAVVAFGFLIERFNLFLLALANSTQGAEKLRLDRLAGPLGRYDGLALIAGGLLLIVVATARFFRTGHLIDDPETHADQSVRAELILMAALVVAVVAFTGYLVLA